MVFYVGYNYTNVYTDNQYDNKMYMCVCIYIYVCVVYGVWMMGIDGRKGGSRLERC